MSLRILITVDADRSPQGPTIPHAYATQIEYLRRAGADVEVFAIDDRTSIPGIRRNVRELRKSIAEYRPDVLVPYYGAMVAGITRRAARGVPIVATFRGSDLLGTSNPGATWRLRDRLGRAIGLWTARKARAIVVNGSGLLRALPERLRAKASNIPNGIDVGIFSPVNLNEARVRLGWPDATPVVLFNAGVGSGQVVKNLPLAEDVVRRMAAGFPGLRLERISTLPREEVSLRMSASDALLVTSLHEGSPDLVKEAMACNLPVVSVPCGDVAERLEGVAACAVRPYDAPALATALAEILSSRSRSDGREHVFRQGLDIESAVRRVHAVYVRAAGEGTVAS